jgi:hypothetical protein
MNHIFMNPRDYAAMEQALTDSPEQRRVRRADRLLQQIGYTQIGQYDICHKMTSLPVFMLHGIRFVRPHYYAIVAVMTRILNHYKQQESSLPLPNLDHLRLAEFIFHAPRAWWKTLDEHRAHILTCVEAGSRPELQWDGANSPVMGRSTTFQQASGVRHTVHASPMVARNQTYSIHQIPQQAIAPGNYGNLTMKPQQPYSAAGSMPLPATTPAGHTTLPHRVVSIPIEPATKSYETPLFTWLLQFTSPIRTLLLSNAASV